MAHRGWKRDGFTPEKKAAAIRALARYGTVADAARVAGVSDTTFFRHLNKDPDFARLCALAREASAKPIETLAWERATIGAEEVTMRGGEVVQVRRKPSDSMMRLLLQASDPKKYGRMSSGSATRRQIEKKLRKEIEAELRAALEAEQAAERAAARADGDGLFERLSKRMEEIEREEREREAREKREKREKRARGAGGG